MSATGAAVIVITGGPRLAPGHQWRLCFRWDAGNAFDVEITDYH